MKLYFLGMTSVKDGYFSHVPKGISKVSAFYTLAKQSSNPNIAAYKLARQAYDNLQRLNVPSKLQENIDVGTLMIKAKPCSDNPELEPLCFRCLQKNPLLNRQGNHCVNCKHPFRFSFIGFEVLPLVEFVPETDIARDDAMTLILQEPLKMYSEKAVNRKNGDIIKQENGYEQLRLGDDDLNEDDDDESAMERLINGEMMSLGAVDTYQPLEVSRDILKSLEPTRVVVQKWDEPRPWQYFWVRLKDQSLTVCPSCQNIFITDDWFLASLSKGHCPFCRRSSSSDDNAQSSFPPKSRLVPKSSSSYMNGVL